MTAELTRQSWSERARRSWRVIRTGYWLGWQVESNWTDPLLFFIYSIARPLGGLLILVFMSYVVARARGTAMLGFFVVGMACWPFVVRGMMGTAHSLISDREHWKMLRYIYIAPISLRAYLTGRALAQVTTSALSAAVVTLAFGRWVLGVPMHLHTMNLPYTALAVVLGIAAVMALGLVVVSAAVLISGEAWRMPEGVGAALYLLCGAIFPVTVLPRALRMLSQGIPVTWWLEAMRRGLLGHAAISSFPSLTDGRVLTLLAVLTAGWIGAATAAFAFAEQRARQTGVLDRESAF